MAGASRMIRIEYFDGKQFYSRELEFDSNDSPRSQAMAIQEALTDFCSELDTGLNAFHYRTRTEINS